MATEVAECLGSGMAIAKAIAGRAVTRACHVCATKSALWYCAADDAYLCTACDTQVHFANALSMRHERVRLTPDGVPKKRSSQSNLVPKDGAPRKRSRTSRPYSHHLRKLTRLSSELVEAKARDSESVELNFDFLDAGEFLCSDAEVPSVSPACSDVEFFAPDLDEFLEGDHTATSDSFTAFLKGKAAHSEHVALDRDQYLVPDAAFGDDLCGVDTPTIVDLANDAFFFPGDIPGLDAFESFAAPEMDLSDDFAITFDLALQDNNTNNPLDAFEGNASVTSYVSGGEPTESDQFMSGPFAKFFATKVKSEAEEPVGAERIKREAREMLKCCEGERAMPCLQLDLKEVLSAWSDRGEPWMVDFKVPQMHSDDSTSSGSDSAGLVPDMDGHRDARVMRYKEKRRTRLFSKKIRYEVRKLNAERRPRMKGRFVKRTSS